MPDIEFSTMMGTPEVLGLDRFEAQSRHRVRHILYPWANAWNELLSIGLHNRGPDVSQVGSTWLGSLAGMEALRPFSPSEIASLGGSTAFLPEVWQSSVIPGMPEIYAIPWIADTRLLVYRRDLLKQAGVDETHAFASHEALVDTLKRLQAAGIPVPLAIPTTEEIIHNAAPWVWGAGGSFRTADRRHLTITDDKTLTGIEQFYSLHTFLAPEARNLTIVQTTDLFQTGRVAVAFTVDTIIPQMVFHAPPAFGLDNLGAAPCPGVPFIGGSHLVIWRHTVYEAAALALIRFLSNPEVQQNLYLKASYLPTHHGALQSELFTTDRLFQAVAHSLEMGRVFQSGYQWGAVEARLQPVFHKLWQDVFANPGLELKSEIAKRLGEISERLEKTLLAS